MYFYVSETLKDFFKIFDNFPVQSVNQAFYQFTHMDHSVTQGLCNGYGSV